MLLIQFNMNDYVKKKNTVFMFVVQYYTIGILVCEWLQRWEMINLCCWVRWRRQVFTLSCISLLLLHCVQIRWNLQNQKKKVIISSNVYHCEMNLLFTTFNETWHTFDEYQMWYSLLHPVIKHQIIAIAITMDFNK